MDGYIGHIVELEGNKGLFVTGQTPLPNSRWPHRTVLSYV